MTTDHILTALRPLHPHAVGRASAAARADLMILWRQMDAAEACGDARALSLAMDEYRRAATAWGVDVSR
jgi:hypothetical protein